LPGAWDLFLIGIFVGSQLGYNLVTEWFELLKCIRNILLCFLEVRVSFTNELDYFFSQPWQVFTIRQGTIVSRWSLWR